ncbi:hypothetical protein DFH94DRAFT_841560 [Russula ochroleuca]|uniref:Fungal STAND N-terminal Goodbye domain-containing protein n=1 Tax=Russula ochroleuca TaxID=152965 RepID=A0A9P5TEA0_9AGAM|nr:hypothetical protein DFH94DRAFT_841560 [Russula ochroleuca]
MVVKSLRDYIEQCFYIQESPHHLPTTPSSLQSLMSHPQPTPASSPDFQLIFTNALKAYEKRTKRDLLAHPLAAQLQDCDSPSAILAVIHQQLEGLHQSQRADERLTKWLDPTINILFAFSGALGEGVGLAFSPAKTIFAGVGVLLSAAIDVRASQEALIDVFERMENFFQRLEIYTEVPPTPEMIDIIVKIMIEVLSILGIATKEMKQGRTKKYLKKLIGRTDIEDALKKLDKLTTEEARMATAQTLKATHTVDDRVRGVDNRVAGVEDKVAGVDDRVAGVDDRVAGVDDKVAAVGNRVAAVDDKVAVVDDRVAGVDHRLGSVEARVASVDDKVKSVDEKVAVVIDGAQLSSVSQQENIFNPDVSRRKRGKASHTTDCKRHGSSKTFVILPLLKPALGVHTQASS